MTKVAGFNTGSPPLRNPGKIWHLTNAIISIVMSSLLHISNREGWVLLSGNFALINHRVPSSVTTSVTEQNTIKMAFALKSASGISLQQRRVAGQPFVDERFASL